MRAPTAVRDTLRRRAGDTSRRPRRHGGPASALRTLAAADARVDELRTQALPGPLDATLRSAAA